MRRFALLLIGCLLLIAGASALDGYGYYQTIEYAACDQDIYQQDIVIHRTTGTAYNEAAGGLETWHIYVGEHCQADYDDVRFTNSTGELAYYLWPDFSAESARFAVRLEGATSAGQMQVWYGNPSATTTSDEDATYLFFDHFKGTSLDTTKWNMVGSPTVSDSNVTVNSSNEEIKSKQIFGAGTILEGRGSLWNANYHIFGLGTHPSSPFIIYQYGHPASGNYNARADSSTALGSGWTGVHTWAIHRVTSGSAKFYLDDSLVATVTTSTADMPILLQQHATATGSSVFDYILVRAYSATPPAALAFSGEQSTAGPPAPALSGFRPKATAPIPTLDESPYLALIEAFGGNKQLNETTEGVDWLGIKDAVERPYTDLIGPFFYVIVFAIPFLMQWLRQGSMAVPAAIGIILAGIMLAKTPAEYHLAAIAFIALSILAVVWGVIKDRN